MTSPNYTPNASTPSLLPGACAAVVAGIHAEFLVYVYDMYRFPSAMCLGEWRKNYDNNKRIPMSDRRRYHNVCRYLVLQLDCYAMVLAAHIVISKQLG